jgi:hypothetical protein
MKLDDEQQHLQPYQLTIYYQNELIRFTKAFQQRANEHYERKWRIFERQQEQHYDRALLVAGGQQ